MTLAQCRLLLFVFGTPPLDVVNVEAVTTDEVLAAGALFPEDPPAA